MKGRALALLTVAGLSACGDPIRLEVVWDDCPEDIDKIKPGACGCGISEATCAPLLSALVHRYAFDGTGRTALDSVGDAHGVVVNAKLLGQGELVLQGGESDQYVDLPNGIVSVLSSATFEAWVVWNATMPAHWERIFDFGVSTLGENQRSNGESYLFLAPEQMFRTAFRNLATGAEILIDSPLTFPVGEPTHVAVVVDPAAGELRLFLNAASQGVVTLPQPLSSVQDVNNWLGRSQFVADTSFGGSFREFRIYAAALSEAELAASFSLGESPHFLAAHR